MLFRSIANNSIIDKFQTEARLKELLSAFPDRKCKVYLLHGNLDDQQMNFLYQHEKIKCLINISHGEGLGLPMLEAASNALPIITIPWSGQTDFLVHNGEKYFTSVKYILKPIQKEAHWKDVLDPKTSWAYPEAGSYKMSLRNMKKKWKTHKKTAEKLQTLVNQKFTKEQLYEQFCDSLDPRTQNEVESTEGMMIL